MTKTLILMQGIAGSGKSTVAQSLHLTMHDSVIRSTDEFWGEEGTDAYNFNASKLGIAHPWNQARVRQDMSNEVPTIIVDNTNIYKKSAVPYLKMAEDFGYVVQVVRVTVPLTVAIERNSHRPDNRRVPNEIIASMYLDMEDLI